MENEKIEISTDSNQSTDIISEPTIHYIIKEREDSLSSDSSNNSS